MSWDFYSLKKGQNGNCFFRAEGKLKKGFVSKDGYKVNIDTLLIYRGKNLPHLKIPIRPKSRFEYDASRLKNIADKFFGKGSIDLIFWRGGFVKIGYKFEKKGRKFKQVPEYTGVVKKIWDRKAPQQF